MNNVATVTLGVGKIKRLARQMMKGKWLMSILVMIIFIVILNAPVYVLSYLVKSRVMDYILDVYSLMMRGPLTLGLAYYFVGVFRADPDSGIGSLTKGFASLWPAVLLYLITMIFTVLWSMLFVIPGIIAAIRYSQAFFIMADNPGMSAFECFTYSKYMMMGNKGKFFRLMLSFLPLIIIVSIPAAIVMGDVMEPMGAMSMEAYLEAVAAAASDPRVILLGLLPELAMVYVLASMACFYDLASGNLVLKYEG